MHCYHHDIFPWFLNPRSPDATSSYLVKEVDLVGTHVMFINLSG